jgi:hypothetical protein
LGTIIVVVQLGEVKIYKAAMEEALRKKEKNRMKLSLQGRANKSVMAFSYPL